MKKRLPYTLFTLLICNAAYSQARWDFVETEGVPLTRNEAAYIESKDKFYFLGGRGVRPVSIYDPVTKQWTEGSQPPLQVHHFQPVVWDDKIYILGAFTGKYPSEKGIDRVLIYDPATDAWSWGDEIPEDRRRGAAGVVLVDDKIYMTGGIVNGHIGGYVNWMDRYDPATGEWVKLSNAPHQRDHFQAAYHNGKIYSAGGRTTSQATKQVFELTVPEVDVYDIASDSWTVLQEPIPTPRAGTSSLTVNDHIVVLGGESAQRKAHAEVEAWDTTEKCWHAYPSLNQGRHGTGMLMYQGYIYTCGGTANRGGKPNLDTTERLSIKELEQNKK